jgi:hypothetical protein
MCCIVLSKTLMFASPNSYRYQLLNFYFKKNRSMTTTTRPIKIKTDKKNCAPMLMKFFFMTAMFFLALNGFSASVISSDPRETKPEKTIKNYFKFPQILMRTTRQNSSISPKKVEELFTTDKSGKANFVSAKTENQLLRKEIEDEFCKFSLLKVCAEIVHRVDLNFQTL